MTNYNKTERDKYNQMWSMQQYRTVSPGASYMPGVISFCKTVGLKSVLDVGCGSGVNIESFIRNDIDAHGIDISDTAMHNPMLQERFTRGEAWDMPFKDSTFDFVFSTDVLEHIPPTMVDQTLSEIARVCSGNAFLSISLIRDTCGNLIGEELHLSIFSPEEWTRRINKYFDIIDEIKEGFGHPRICYILKPKKQKG